MLEIQTKQLPPDIVVLEITGKITIGRDCTAKACAIRGFASTSTLPKIHAPPASVANRRKMADSGWPGSAQLAHRSTTTSTCDEACSRLPKLDSSTSTTYGEGSSVSGAPTAPVPPGGGAGRFFKPERSMAPAKAADMVAAA